MCLEEDQTTACANVVEGETCSWGTEQRERGICVRDGSALLCVPGCGDGNRGGAEECDDGNFATHDGCSSACLQEAASWTDWQDPFIPRRGHVAVYHQQANKLVVLGGFDNEDLFDQWERDSTGRWKHSMLPLQVPRFSAAAYDSNRHVIVVFGGVSVQAGARSDTWEYDGVSWTQKTPSTSPSPRYAAAMAFDPASNRIVLFGGLAADTTVLGETWTYDGSTWTQVTTPAPPKRYFSALATDTDRDRVLLFGGVDNQGGFLYNDVWEYAATTWTKITPATAIVPQQRHSHAMAYLPQPTSRKRFVVFGGATAVAFNSADTWEWDPATSTWTQVARPATPPGRAWASLTYIGGTKLALVAGSDNLSAGARRDVWEYDNSSTQDILNGWTEHTPRLAPSIRSANLVFDELRMQTMLFGGYGIEGFTSDTWVYRQEQWLELASTTHPSTRGFPRLVDDPLRGRVVLFGGAQGGTFFNDTWEWDGSTWTERIVAQKPPGRQNHGLTFDTDTGSVILFGGQGLGESLADTWELDASGWTNVATSDSPPSDPHPPMAYDRNSRRTILFDHDGVTWAYKARQWSRLPEAGGPGARSNPYVTWDPTRQRVVLFGGSSAETGVKNDVWEFDGTAWTQVTVVGDPPAARFYGGWAAYRPGRSVMLFGGQSGFGFIDQIAFLEYSSATPDEDCTNASDDDGDLHVDAADPDCGP